MTQRCSSRPYAFICAAGMTPAIVAAVIAPDRNEAVE
jgi:hypothetical protein